MKRSIVALVIAIVTTSIPSAQSHAIRVVLLGTAGGPRPDPVRAGPSAWVEAGGERLFVDAGRGAVLRMAQAGLDPSRVTRLFLTHLHSDHTVGLPDLWLSGWWIARSAPLEVRGPVGTRAMVEHLRQAFAADVDLRVAPPERLSRETAGIAGFDVAEGVVYESGGVRVTAIRVDHGPVPTFAYRIDHAGRSVVFSGDDRKSDNLIAKAQQVDVLFHPMFGFTPEELREPGRIGERRRAAVELIATPEDAAAVFRASRCKVAVLTHSSRDDQSLARVRAAFSGRLELADDLTEVLVGDDVVVKSMK